MACSAVGLRAWLALSPLLAISKQHVPPTRLLLEVPFPKTKAQSQLAFANIIAPSAKVDFEALSSSPGVASFTSCHRLTRRKSARRIHADIAKIMNFRVCLCVTT